MQAGAAMDAGPVVSSIRASAVSSRADEGHGNLAYRFAPAPVVLFSFFIGLLPPIV
jgi:hypothetical protein